MKILRIMFILLLSKVESTTYGKNEEEWKNKIVANELIFENDDKLDKLPPSARSQNDYDDIIESDETSSRPKLSNEASWKDDGTEEKPISTSKSEKIMPKIDHEPSIELDSSLIISQSFVNKEMLETKLSATNFKIDADSITYGLFLAELSLLQYIAEGKVSHTTKIFGSKYYYYYIQMNDDDDKAAATAAADDKDASAYDYKEGFYSIKNPIFYTNNKELYCLALNQEDDTKLILIKLLPLVDKFIPFNNEIDKLRTLQNKLDRDKDYEATIQTLQKQLEQQEVFKCLNEMIDCVNKKGSNYENIKNKFSALLNISDVNLIKEISLSELEWTELCSLKHRIKEEDNKSSLSNIPKIKVSMMKKLKTDTSEKQRLEKKFKDTLKKLMPNYNIYYVELIPTSYTGSLFLFKFEENGCNYMLINAYIGGDNVTLGLNKKLNKVVIVELLPGMQIDLSETKI